MDLPTVEDLENMTVEERKTLAEKLGKLQEKLEDLEYREETYPQRLANVKKEIEKCGVTFEYGISDNLVAEGLFDFNEISVDIIIRARPDNDWRPDEETAEFSAYDDYDFGQKYSAVLPNDVDFWNLYRGEAINWDADGGAIYTATYSINLYAITKKFDLEKIATQVPLDCFIMDEEDTKKWVYECSVVRFDSGEFKIATKDKEWTATLDELAGRCYEKHPRF